MDPIPTLDVDARRFSEDDRFVRALLRRLTADPHLVDDLAQETWLAALRHGPGHIGRAWLGTVARNFLLQSLRGGERRAMREQAVARNDSTESEDGAPDPDQCRRLLAAVAGLDESYRSVIRLRFYDDLMPGEIAERLDLPIETVRTRLKRALSRIHQTCMKASRTRSG